MSVAAVNAEIQIIWERIVRLEREVESLKQELARNSPERRDIQQSRP